MFPVQWNLKFGLKPSKYSHSTETALGFEYCKNLLHYTQILKNGSGLLWIQEILLRGDSVGLGTSEETIQDEELSKNHTTLSILAASRRIHLSPSTVHWISEKCLFCSSMSLEIFKNWTMWQTKTVKVCRTFAYSWTAILDTFWCMFCIKDIVDKPQVIYQGWWVSQWAQPSDVWTVQVLSHGLLCKLNVSQAHMFWKIRC